MVDRASQLESIPQSPDAERAVLGAILLSNGSLCPAASALLAADDFFVDSHRRIFLRMQGMGEQAKPVDLVTLSEELMRHDELEAVGGAAYISSLTDGLPASANIDHYAQIVLDRKKRRSILSASNVLAGEAIDRGIPPEEAAARGTRLLLDMEAQPKRGLRQLGAVFQDSFETVDSLVAASNQDGMETGYSRLDALTGGLHRGEMALIAARPSLGKTSLVLNIAVNIAKRNMPVAIFSLEMTARSVLMRMICAEARVDWNKWAAGYLNHDEGTKMVLASGALSGLPIHVDDDSSVRPEVMLARAMKLKIESSNDLPLVIVDYAQLVQPGGKQESRVQEISFVSRFLKRMAKELNCAMLVCCQLNRSPEETERSPRLSDLKDSGQLEQDADLVLFLWRQTRKKRRGNVDALLSGQDQAADSHGDDGLVTATIGKQRNGPIGEFKLAFIGKYCKFETAYSGDADGEPMT
jgi:replicative DNA helicase